MLYKLLHKHLERNLTFYHEYLPRIFSIIQKGTHEVKSRGEKGGKATKTIKKGYKNNTKASSIASAVTERYGKTIRNFI